MYVCVKKTSLVVSLFAKSKGSGCRGNNIWTVPLGAMPIWAPWAPMGRALMGWALMLGPYGLGCDGPGPYGTAWARMGWALVRRAHLGWARMGLPRPFFDLFYPPPLVQSN